MNSNMLKFADLVKAIFHYDEKNDDIDAMVAQKEKQALALFTGAVLRR